MYGVLKKSTPVPVSPVPSAQLQKNITEGCSFVFVVGDLCSAVKRRKQKLFAVKRRKQNPKCTGCMFSKTTFLNRIPVLRYRADRYSSTFFITLYMYQLVL